MNNISNISNMSLLGSKGGALFKPASISVNGEKTLLQQVLTKQSPTLSGVVYDERKNKGSARPIQLGRCYNFDGTNDTVVMNSPLTLFHNSSNAWRVKFYYTPSTVIGVRRMVAQQGAGYKGVSIYTNVNTIRVDIINVVSTNQLTAICNDTSLVAGTTYEIEVIYDGSKVYTGVSFKINGVTRGSTLQVNNLTQDDTIAKDGTGTIILPLRLGSDGTGTNGANFASGKLWGVQIWNGAGTLVAMYKCDEIIDAYCFDSAGTNNGTITDATLSNFHATQDLTSYHNDVGYTTQRNLTAPSEDFTSANYGKTTTTVTANQDTAPDGTLTADLLTPTGTDSGVFFGSNQNAGTYTFSCYLRSATGANVNTDLSVYNLTTSLKAGATTCVVTTTWQRFSVTYTLTATSNMRNIIGAFNTLATGENLYAWGFQVEKGTLTEYQKSLGSGWVEGRLIPRNENNTAYDVLGELLQYTGGVPYDADLEQSNCAVFDGVNNVITIPNKSQLVFQGGDFTLSFRAKSDLADITSSPCLFSKWSVGNYEWKINLTTTEKLQVYTSDGSAFPSINTVNAITNITDWHTYTITKTGITVKIYVDGVEVPVIGSAIGTLTNGTTGISIGATITGTEPFDGSMCDVRMYPSTLSASDVLAIHNRTYDGTPVLYQPIACGSGTVSCDVSGNNNHGTLVNAPTWGKQDMYHYNFVKGFSRYTHISLPNILVPYGIDGNPLSITPPTGYTKLTDNPAGPYHNGAETLIDFTNNVLSPEAVRNSWETAWAFNTARTNPEFKRTLTLATVAHRNDRFLAYRDALTGANLSKVNKYVTTKAI